MDCSKRCFGFPAQFVFDFAGVDGVSAVVAGAVFYVLNAVVPVFAHFVEDGFGDFAVGDFVVAADVVDLAGRASIQDRPDGFAMVFDVEPVADVQAVAVEGDFFAFHQIGDEERDQFFGEMVWAVVVAAAGDQHGHVEGVEIGADQAIGGGFAGAVGAVGLERRFFGEFELGPIFGQRAVDFVGADLQKFFDVSALATSSRTCVPTTLVCTNGPEPRMERSTWVSAAKLTTCVILC